MWAICNKHSQFFIYFLYYWYIQGLYTKKFSVFRHTIVNKFFLSKIITFRLFSFLLFCTNCFNHHICITSCWLFDKYQETVPSVTKHRQCLNMQHVSKQFYTLEFYIPFISRPWYIYDTASAIIICRHLGNRFGVDKHHTIKNSLF